MFAAGSIKPDGYDSQGSSLRFPSGFRTAVGFAMGVGLAIFVVDFQMFVSVNVWLLMSSRLNARAFTAESGLYGGVA